MDNKKSKCQKCGSGNVNITRDARTHMREYICQKCGNAWYHEGDKKLSTIGFVLGFIIIFIVVVVVMAMI